MHKTFAIIGGGRVGTALGKQLTEAGFKPTGVCCRSRESAEKAAAIIGTGKAVDTPWFITPKAEIVFITTPDGVIAETSQLIADHHGFCQDAVVIHCSGALPSTVLPVPEKANIHRGSLHPLQSFAGQEISGNPFEKIIMAIEGDPAAVTCAREIGKTLGATCFTIKTEAKRLYHAAAVVASNYLVTLVGTAFTLLETAGINRDEAFAILSPLIKGTLANIKNVGIPDALTGPIARGDESTVADHLENIQAESKDSLALYRMLGRHTIPLALAKGTISDFQAERLRQLLDS